MNSAASRFTAKRTPPFAWERSELGSETVDAGSRGQDAIDGALPISPPRTRRELDVVQGDGGPGSGYANRNTHRSVARIVEDGVRTDRQIDETIGAVARKGRAGDRLR